MKRQKSTILIIGILILFTAVTFAGNKKLYRVGFRPMLKAGVETQEALRAFVSEHAEELKAGFNYGGYADLYEPFMKQFAVSELKETEITQGQQMAWMMFRSSDGNIKVVKELEWANKKPLKVFRFTMVTNCRDYDFIIPAKCANITLISETNSRAVCNLKVSPEKVNVGEEIKIDISGSKCVSTLRAQIVAQDGSVVASQEISADNPVWTPTLAKPGDYQIKGVALNTQGEEGDSCTASVHVNFPPVCDLKVNPQRSYVGKAFTLDASGSSDPDGEVVKAEFMIKNKAGEVVETIQAKEKPFSLEKIFKKSGRFTVAAKVTDDMGAFADNCETSIEVEKRFYALVEGGPGVVRGTYSGYLFARFGFLYMLMPDTLDLVVSLGPAINLNGAPFKSFFMGNVVLNGRFDKFFAGGGFGFTSKVKEWEQGEMDDWTSGLNLVLNMGYDVVRSFNARGSIFFEFQMPLHDSLKLKDYHMFLLGFRYIF